MLVASSLSLAFKLTLYSEFFAFNTVAHMENNLSTLLLSTCPLSCFLNPLNHCSSYPNT